MFTSNPFAELSLSVSPAIMQTYVAIMIVLVAAGTVFDMLHKKSARYFFENWRRVRDKGARRLGNGEMMSLAVQTAVVDVMMSREFCNPRRRIAHLLTMYGFVIYIAASVIMVFAYPTSTSPTPVLLPLMWYIGALMVCAGGYWFWLVIRVDVAAEGNPPLRVVRADLFILSLLASTTLGLIWAIVQSAGAATASYVFLAFYLVGTTVLFGSVPWSKFSHMFFKPAAAFQLRVEEANGSRRGLPASADRPASFGTARQQPRHF
jgi:hypothetical protein